LELSYPRHQFNFLRSYDARAPNNLYPGYWASRSKAMEAVELPAVALIGLLIVVVTMAAIVVWLAKSVSIA
jgi:hypothetical protein